MRKGLKHLQKRSKWFWLFTFTIYLIMQAPAGAEPEAAPLVYSIQVHDTVTSGTASYISRSIKAAEADKAQAVVILLDTPGGLASATLEIVEAISSARVPVITFVTPRGAISASAGTFILLSGHIAAMSPGTTCGAAMPIRISSLGKYQPADEKTITFMAEHMASLAGERGRPTDLARRFVTENLSLSNRSALEQGMVEVEAVDLAGLLNQVNGRQVQTGAARQTLYTTGASVKNLDMNTRERLVHVLSNPTTALLLIIIGLYGLIFALHSPGFFLPEVLGSISLVLGLYGIGLFTVNLTAGLLILLGLGLLIAEAYSPTNGVLGLGGIASLVLGILFFPVEPLLPVSWWQSFRFMAIGVGVIGAGLLSIILRGIWNLRRIRPVHGTLEFSDKMGVVVKPLVPEGLVMVQGEIWQARSSDGHSINDKDKVKIIKKEGLKLVVEKVGEKG